MNFPSQVILPPVRMPTKTNEMTFQSFWWVHWDQCWLDRPITFHILVGPKRP